MRLPLRQRPVPRKACYTRCAGEIEPLRRDLNKVKREQFPWVYDVSKCVVQEAIIDLGAAFRAFFEKRGRYPRFKRKEGRARFCAANEAGTFRTDGKRIKLPVIAWIRMREAVRFSGRLKRVTVSREGDRWFASIVVETAGGDTRFLTKAATL